MEQIRESSNGVSAHASNSTKGHPRHLIPVLFRPSKLRLHTRTTRSRPVPITGFAGTQKSYSFANVLQDRGRLDTPAIARKRFGNRSNPLCSASSPARLFDWKTGRPLVRNASFHCSRMVQLVPIFPHMLSRTYSVRLHRALCHTDIRLSRRCHVTAHTYSTLLQMNEPACLTRKSDTPFDGRAVVLLGERRTAMGRRGREWSLGTL